MVASWLPMDDYFKDITVDATAILAPYLTSDNRLDLAGDVGLRYLQPQIIYKCDKDLASFVAYILLVMQL